jgi:hypothetical protein
MLQALTVPAIFRSSNELRGKPVGADCRSGSTPVVEKYDVRGLSEVSPKVAETWADQCYSRSQLIRFNLHIPGPMMNLEVIRGVDQNGSVRDRTLHGRYSTRFDPITAYQNHGSNISIEFVHCVQ